MTNEIFEKNVAVLEPLLSGRKAVGVFGVKSAYKDLAEMNFWCQLAHQVGAQIARSDYHLVCGGQADAGIQSSVSEGFASVHKVPRPIALPGFVEQVAQAASFGIHPEHDPRRRGAEPSLHYVLYSELGSYRGAQHPNANINRNTLEARVISGAIIFPGGNVGTTNELAWTIHYGKPWVYVGSEKHWQEHLANLPSWSSIIPTRAALGSPEWLEETKGQLLFVEPGGAAPDLSEFLARL